MTNQEALKILCDGTNKFGKIDETTIEITPTNIRINLEDNNYKLNLNFIQDLMGIDTATGNVELYQGHSLEEVSFD